MNVKSDAEIGKKQERKKTMKVITRMILLGVLMSSMALAEEEISFLGVSTYSADRATATQLGLPRGTGLAVSHVSDSGPADGVIEPDDILIKYTDQILINPEQLGVLVRMNKPGDKANVELIRKGGKITVEVTLGSRPDDLAFEPDFRMPDFKIMGPMMRPFSFGDDNDITVDGQLNGNTLMDIISSEMMKNADGFRNMEETIGQMSNILKNIRINTRTGQTITDNDAFRKGDVRTEIFTSTSTGMMDKSGNTISLSQNGANDAVLKITDKIGKVVFEGPVNTDEEKNKIPEKYRESLDKMLNINQTPWDEGDFEAVDDEENLL